MINGCHVILYSRDAQADRAFFADVLGYPNVDAGGGWLRSSDSRRRRSPCIRRTTRSRRRSTSCRDDVEKTVAELAAQGVEFTQPVTDAGWGLLTRLRLPGGGEVGMYEPRHERATDL